MANSKETPRQRMIGMMYLVLTALLALQVSSAMIYKFQTLNESLEHSAKATTLWSAQKISAMADAVKNRGNKAQEVQLLASANEIAKKSKEMQEYIEKLKKELIIESGGYDEEGNLKGAKEETKVEVIMIGANKNGKAYELKKKLEAYVKFMSEKTKIKFEPLALDGKDDPMFQKNEEQRNKDFAQLNFGQTPLVAGLAILSEIQSRVSSMESNSVTAYADKVGVNDFPIDKIMPVVSPVSRVVPAGTKYEAKLLMAATSSSQKPEMFMGETMLPVDGDGVGSVSFLASGGNYTDGFLKKTWTGKVKMKKADGGDTIYTFTEEYLVSQPVIEVDAQEVSALYRNCGNKLNVKVPALGTAYNPSISAEGAQVITSSQRGQVTVVPTAASVKLRVNSNGMYLGEKKFRVRLIPLPTIEVRANGREVDPIQGVPLEMLRNLSVKAIAEKQFKEALPADAIYKVVEWNYILVSGRTGRGNNVIKNREYSDISQLRNAARKGDRIVVEVKKVQRKNFRGQWEDVSIPVKIETIPIV